MSAAVAAEYVVKGFEKLTPDLSSIAADAQRYSHEQWVNTQTASAATTGAAAMLVPGAHMIAFAADLAILMNRMAVTAYGVGVIASRGSALDIERDDFALVLAMWSGEYSRASVLDAGRALAAKVAAKAAPKVAAKVGTKAGSKLIATAIGNTLGIMVGKKLGPKTATKVGSKLAGKLLAKGGAGWIPFVGAAVGAGINGYFIRNIAGAARTYYECKREIVTTYDLGHLEDLEPLLEP